jgi:hypothetical protein
MGFHYNLLAREIKLSSALIEGGGGSAEVPDGFGCRDDGLGVPTRDRAYGSGLSLSRGRFGFTRTSPYCV